MAFSRRTVLRHPRATATAIACLLLLIHVVTYLLDGHRTLPGRTLVTLNPNLMDRSFVLLPADMRARLSPSQAACLEDWLHRRGLTVYRDLADIPEEKLVYWPIAAEEIIGFERRRREDPPLTQAYIAEREAEFAAGRRLVGLQGGVRLDWQQEWGVPFVAAARSSRWVSNTGADFRSDIYVWGLWRWWRIANRWHGVS